MDFENQVEEIADQESVVDSQEEDVTEEEPDTSEGEQEEPATQPRQPKQSHQDNAAAKAARIRAEQETTEALKRQYDAQIAALGIGDPYTNKPFSSLSDLMEYGKRFNADRDAEEAQRRGTTVQQLQEERDNQEWISKKRREDAEQKRAMEEAATRRAFLLKDLSYFMDKHPDVDPGKLEKNPKFQKFAKGRLYKEPLSEIYDDFVELVSDAERSAVEKVARKTGRSTGGGQSGGADGLTPAQRADLEEWNRDNPSMKMTAKEFLSM